MGPGGGNMMMMGGQKAKTLKVRFDAFSPT